MRRMYSENQLLKAIENESKENGITLGNTTIDKNLKVKGILEVDEYELDQDITFSNLPSGLTCYYAHARISNGKLNIVCAFGAQSGASDSEEIDAASLSLSEDILAKLIPYVTNVLVTEAKHTSYGNSPFESDGIIMLRVRKQNDYISFSLGTKSIESLSVTQIARFEFNFIL